MKNNKTFLILSSLLSLALFSCNSTTSSNKSNDDDTKDNETISLINNGISEYKVLIPSSPNSNESFASSELVYFLESSTGAKLEILDDSSLQDDKYISLGLTSKLKNSSLYKEENYGLSGYRVFNENDNIYIYGSTLDGEGTLYGTYDFLHELIGFEVYSSDEIYYKKINNVAFNKKDEIVKPSFDTRVIGYKSTNSDSLLSKRLRLTNQYSDQKWFGFGHSQLSTFLDITKRDEKIESGEWDSSWFSNGLKNPRFVQLCYTGGEKLVKAVADRFIEFFIAYPNAMYFMFGQEDNANFCTCQRCLSAMEEWGCNTAGLQIAFMNEVIKITENWIEQNQKGREIRYVVFSYMDTTNPPVKVNGDFIVPFSNKVVPSDKLYFYFAPIGSDFSSSLDSISNKTYFDAIKGWNVLAGGRILCYIYDINFSNYFINFYNVNSTKDMYKKYKEFGVTYMYTQGPLDTSVPGFEQARIYIESKLMWDVDRNYEDLLNDFLIHYYGDASIFVKKYWDLTFDACEEYAVKGNYIGGIYSAINDSSLWNEGLVSAFRKTFDEAYSSIEKTRLLDLTRYEEIYSRLKKIEVTVLFLELSYYQSYFSESEIEQKKNDFEKYCKQLGMNKTSEGGNLPTV